MGVYDWGSVERWWCDLRGKFVREVRLGGKRRTHGMGRGEEVEGNESSDSLSRSSGVGAASM